MSGISNDPYNLKIQSGTYNTNGMSRQQQVKYLVGAELQNKVFESMEGFKEICGDLYEDLNIRQVYGNGTYNYYEVSSKYDESVRTTVMVKANAVKAAPLPAEDEKEKRADAVKDFINNKLKGKSFESADEFKEFCGDFYDDLNIRQVYGNGIYNYYEVSSKYDETVHVGISFKANNNNKVEQQTTKSETKATVESDDIDNVDNKNTDDNIPEDDTITNESGNPEQPKSDNQQNMIKKLYDLMYKIDTNKDDYTTLADCNELYKLIDEVNNNPDKYPDLKVIIKEKEDKLCDIEFKVNDIYYYNIDDIPSRVVDETKEADGIEQTDNIGIKETENKKSDSIYTDEEISVIVEFFKDTLPNITAEDVKSMADDLAQMAESKGVEPTDYVSARLVDFLEMRAESPDMSLEEMNESVALENVSSMLIDNISSIYSNIFGEEIETIEDLFEIQELALWGADYEPELRSAYMSTREFAYLQFAKNDDFTKEDYYNSLKNDLANLFPQVNDINDEEAEELRLKIDKLDLDQVKEFINKTLMLSAIDDENYQTEYQIFLAEFNSAVKNSTFKGIENPDEIMDLDSIYKDVAGVDFNPDVIIDKTILLNNIKDGLDASVTYQAALNIFDKVDSGDLDEGAALWQIGCLYTGSTEVEDIENFIKEITGKDDIYIENNTVIIPQTAAARRRGACETEDNNSNKSVLDTVKDWCGSVWDSFAEFTLSESTREINAKHDKTTISGFCDWVADTLSNPDFYKDFGNWCQAGALGCTIASAAVVDAPVTLTGAGILEIVGGASYSIGAILNAFQNPDSSYAGITNTIADIMTGLTSMVGGKYVSAAYEVQSTLKGVWNSFTSAVNKYENKSYSHYLQVQRIRSLLWKAQDFTENLGKEFNAQIFSLTNTLGKSGWLKTKDGIKYSAAFQKELDHFKAFAGVERKPFNRYGGQYVEFDIGTDIPEDIHFFECLYSPSVDKALQKQFSELDDLIAKSGAASMDDKIEIWANYVYGKTGGTSFIGYQVGKNKNLKDKLFGEIFENAGKYTVCRHRSAYAHILGKHIGLDIRTVCGNLGKNGYITGNHAWNEIVDGCGNLRVYDFNNVDKGLVENIGFLKTYLKDTRGNIPFYDLTNVATQFDCDNTALKILGYSGLIVLLEYIGLSVALNNHNTKTPDDNNNHTNSYKNEETVVKTNPDGSKTEIRYLGDKENYYVKYYDKDGREYKEESYIDGEKSSTKNINEDGSYDKTYYYGEERSTTLYYDKNERIYRRTVYKDGKTEVFDYPKTNDNNGTQNTAGGTTACTVISSGETDCSSMLNGTTTVTGNGEVVTGSITNNLTAEERQSIIEGLIKAKTEELAKEHAGENVDIDVYFDTDGHLHWSVTTADANNATASVLSDLDKRIEDALNDPNYLLASTEGGGNDDVLGFLIGLKSDVYDGKYLDENGVFNYVEYYKAMAEKGLIDNFSVTQNTDENGHSYLVCSFYVDGKWISHGKDVSVKKDNNISENIPPIDKSRDDGYGVNEIYRDALAEQLEKFTDYEQAAELAEAIRNGFIPKELLEKLDENVSDCLNGLIELIGSDGKFSADPDKNFNGFSLLCGGRDLENYANSLVRMGLYKDVQQARDAISDYLGLRGGIGIVIDAQGFFEMLTDLTSKDLLGIDGLRTRTQMLVSEAKYAQATGNKAQFDSLMKVINENVGIINRYDMIQTLNEQISDLFGIATYVWYGSENVSYHFDTEYSQAAAANAIFNYAYEKMEEDEAMGYNNFQMMLRMQDRITALSHLKDQIENSRTMGEVQDYLDIFNNGEENRNTYSWLNTSNDFWDLGGNTPEPQERRYSQIQTVSYVDSLRWTIENIRDDIYRNPSKYYYRPFGGQIQYYPEYERAQKQIEELYQQIAQIEDQMQNLQLKYYEAVLYYGCNSEQAQKAKDSYERTMKEYYSTDSYSATQCETFYYA